MIVTGATTCRERPHEPAGRHPGEPDGVPGQVRLVCVSDRERQTSQPLETVCAVGERQKRLKPQEALQLFWAEAEDRFDAPTELTLAQEERSAHSTDRVRAPRLQLLQNVGCETRLRWLAVESPSQRSDEQRERRRG
ncbi:MAG TPA: hypothetical protein VGU02_16370 [Gaiellaceae bacterium]|nr:hypothetical protein [Gaiellaceae bacterium]